MTTTTPTTYRVTFIPDDANIGAGIYGEGTDDYAPTLDAALRIIAGDMISTAHNHYDAGDTATGNAYMAAAARVATTAIPPHGLTAWPVEVTEGPNPRTIGTYMTTPYTIGDAATCDHCASEFGRITDIGTDGSAIACCPLCAGLDD